ncbi:hypothetical protein [Actinopolymorpha sp. B9G3]|uniref:hypothetical protein n=1 Tax=Actinopolymorpha sp. B9G3 TaxID=3158970 RepID=UPI0032D97CBA
MKRRTFLSGVAAAGILACEIPAVHASDSVELSAALFDDSRLVGLTADGDGYESAAKRLIRCHDGGLWLEAMASAEYDRPRQPGEPWPHLLVEQVWGAAGVRLVDLAKLQFGLTARVDHVVNCMSPAEYDPGLHAAQVTAYFTLQNRNESSPDYGNLVWFGVPVVDNRYDIPPAHYAEDAGHTGPTNQFIAVMPGSEFWDRSIKDGRWHSIRTDLLPFLHHAFSVAQQGGYLPRTRVEELRITTFNFGWELPGAFDVALQVKPLTAVAVVR